MKFPSLALVLLLLSNFGFSQSISNLIPGYIVKDGDTLRGYVLDRNDKWTVDAISFFSSQNSQPTQYPLSSFTSMYLQKYDAFYFVQPVEYDIKPTQMVSLEDNGSRNMVADTVLLRLLAGGRLNLFDYTDRNSKRHFFIQKDQGKIEELAFVRYRTANGKAAELAFYKGTITALAADCNKPSLPAPQLAEKSLIAYVNRYNECVGVEQYRHKEERSRLSLIVTGGIALGSANFVGSDITSGGFQNIANGKYSSTSVVNLGVDMELVPARTTNRSRPGIHLSYLSSGKTETTNQVLFYTLEFKTLNLGPSYRYNITQSRLVNPYVKGSLGAAYILNGDGTRVSSSSPAPRTFIPFASFGYYAFASAGIQVRRLTFEVRAQLLHEVGQTPAAARLPSLGANLGFQLLK